MRLLVLAGTAEARLVIAALSGDRRVRIIASLAGATRRPIPLGVVTRIGGFGGRDAYADWLRREAIDAVLDATHPFAARMSHRTAEVCEELAIPHIQFLRPAWRPVPEDSWTFLNTAAEAARHIEPGARVFLGTGRQSLPDFVGLDRVTLFARVIDRPTGPFPLPNGSFVVGRPPFSVSDEIELFDRLRIDWLVVKNAGGPASAPKLEAARAMGIPVAMIRRPYQPQGPKVETVAEALAWVRRRL